MTANYFSAFIGWKNIYWAVAMWQALLSVEITSSKQTGKTDSSCELSHFIRVWQFATLWTVAHQAPLSKGFSRQEYWSKLPCPPPGDLPNLGIEPKSPTLQADSLPTEPPGKPWTVQFGVTMGKIGVNVPIQAFANISFHFFGINAQ